MLGSAGSMGHKVTCRTASERHSCPGGEQTGVAGGEGGAQGGVGPVGLVTEPGAKNVLWGDRREECLDFLNHMLPFKVQYMNSTKGSHRSSSPGPTGL